MSDNDQDTFECDEQGNAVGGGSDDGGGSSGPDDPPPAGSAPRPGGPKAFRTTERLLIQSNLHQSVSQAVQSAADLLNAINTTEATVIGVASAKWLEDPTNPEYLNIIKNAKENITFAVDNLRDVGSAAKVVLEDLNPEVKT